MANQPTTFNDNDEVRGIDVSHHNGGVDWQKVRAANIAFAFTKATEGDGLKDTRFTANYAAIKSNGILRGAYHFFRPGGDAKAQADSFLRVVNQLLPGDLPPALDVEAHDGKDANAIIDGVQQWLNIVGEALGRAPLIYTSASFWNTRLNGAAQFSGHTLWVAHYTSKPKPIIPRGFVSHTIWQFSELGKVDGVSSNQVDLNRFNGTIADLRQLAGL
jgi:lysozyme